MYGLIDEEIDLFPKEKRPYLIFAPSYTHTSSGVKTLHLLCHALNQKGYKSYLMANDNGYRINFDLNTPILSFGVPHLDPVFVYPDITYGSPWAGPIEPKHVVRYLLANPLYPEKFGKDDKIWGYTTPLAQRHGSDKVLTLPTFNKKIFYPPEEKSARSGSCFYAHKYDKIFGNKLLTLTEGMTRVEGSQEQVAHILRSCETCYVYERSEIIVNAALCGCKVVLIENDYFMTIDSDELFPFKGLSWSDGSRAHTDEDVYSRVEKIEENFNSQLNVFISETQNG